MRYILLAFVFCLNPLFSADVSARHNHRQKNVAHKNIEKNRINNLKDMWQAIADPKELDNLDRLYRSDVDFTDPMVKFVGLDKLEKYWKGLYEKYYFIEFRYVSHDVSRSNTNKYFVHWEMWVQMSPEEEGPSLRTTGLSEVRFYGNSNKVSYQRDIFDMGEALYEHIPDAIIPGFSAVVKGFKARARESVKDEVPQ